MKIIAYYLPQFYPFKENNQWWGEGFTEWTNVGKAKKLFKNHYQPKVPADLGYYDLRLHDVSLAQASLAKEAGIDCFCYWHYWFGNGKRLLDLPIDRIISSGTPDLPFCLGWANESWFSKVWNTDKNKKDKLLIEQLYPGPDDVIAHFNSIKKYILDDRYFKIDGKPVFVIYKPLLLKDAIDYLKLWNDLIKSLGFEEFYFIGHTVNEAEVDPILNLGFKAVNIVRIGEHRFNKNVIKRIPFQLLKYKMFHKPLKLNYSFISKYFIGDIEKRHNVYPTLIPNWDHTPRSGKKGLVFQDSTPELFYKHVKKTINIVKNKDLSNQIVFLKSWNEWGEGNYMEPDLRYGKSYIHALRKALNDFLL